MKAWRLHKIGKHICEELPVPQLKEDEVLVRVKAVGICGSDIPRIYKDGAHRMPLTCGHEFSGEVVKCGENADKTFQGKRVGIFPLIPCGRCEACAEKKYEMCMNYSYLGSRCDGGFAEYAAVPSWNLIELPGNISNEQAAMLEPMSVAVHALRRVELSADDIVVIHGMGTIGQFLLMFLLEQGIKQIYVMGNKAVQKDVALSLGLSPDNFCDISTEAIEMFAARHPDMKRVNVVFDCVGRNEVLNQAIRMVRFGGKVCLVGNPVSDVLLPKEVYWKILRKQLTVTGTWNSSFWGEDDKEAVRDDWHYVVKRLQENRISPEKVITHRYGLADLSKGLELMRDKIEGYVKVMIYTDDKNDWESK